MKHSILSKITICATMIILLTNCTQETPNRDQNMLSNTTSDQTSRMWKVELIQQKKTPLSSLYLPYMEESHVYVCSNHEETIEVEKTSVDKKINIGDSVQILSVKNNSTSPATYNYFIRKNYPTNYKEFGRQEEAIDHHNLGVGLVWFLIFLIVIVVPTMFLRNQLEKQKYY